MLPFDTPQELLRVVPIEIWLGLVASLALLSTEARLRIVDFIPMVARFFLLWCGIERAGIGPGITVLILAYEVGLI